MNIFSIFWQSITITLFVLSMMLIIEFINVFSKGKWTEKLRKKPVMQIVIGALLGIIPGCLGAYTAVSLFVHNIIGKGALVATMIATSGDEAFFMFSIIPKTAILITVILFIVALIAGFIVNYFTKSKDEFPIKHFEIHDEANERFRFSIEEISKQIKQITILRLVLILALVASIVLIAIDFSHFMEDFGNMGHGHESHASHEHLHPEWISVTFLIVLGASLIITFLVSDHFLNAHLWNHILKKHFIRIFTWTFLTLLAIHFASQYFNIETLIGSNLLVVLIIAVLVGIIPESGPHLVFIILFASGNLPLSILLASSIVQDGHGSLPLLAESQKNFFIIKAINVLVGLLIGLIGLAAGF